VGKTTLQSGDELTLLADNSRSNLFLLREGGHVMVIRSEEGELPITGIGKVFSRNEARLLAIGLAVATGLSLEERGPVFPGNNVIFRFD